MRFEAALHDARLQVSSRIRSGGLKSQSFSAVAWAQGVATAGGESLQGVPGRLGPAVRPRSSGFGVLGAAAMSRVPLRLPRLMALTLILAQARGGAAGPEDVVLAGGCRGVWGRYGMFWRRGCVSKQHSV